MPRPDQEFRSLVAVDFAPPKPPGRMRRLLPVLVILASAVLICGAAVTYLLLR